MKHCFVHSFSALTLLLLLPLFGCAGADQAAGGSPRELSAGIKAPQAPQAAGLAPADRAAAQDFTMQIFSRTLAEGENSLTAPISVLYALGMTSNGAQGRTLEQMEAALGFGREQLNSCLAAYARSLAADANGAVRIANSVWLKDSPALEIRPDFLQTNAASYRADVFAAPFNADTVRAINSWVAKHTNGLIKQLVNELDEETVMCLLNAVAFEAKWQEPFMEHQVRPGDFTAADGFVQKADFMYCTEHTYLEDEQAAGFLRYYEGRFAFLALLPNADTSVWDYAAGLDGERLRGLLAARQYTEVVCSIPKFSAEYSVDMKSCLQAMGIADAFDVNLADFSAMAASADGNIYIGEVLHKARIEVDEQGTRAGAATDVTMKCGAAGPPEPPKVVYLDRPFIYMLLDCENELPLFVGVTAAVK